MIHPNMATLLGIICTDAPITPSATQALLSAAIEKSFNSISIDGDTSTNDTVCLLANGAGAPQGVQPVSAPNSDDFVHMKEVLTAFAADLAQLVVRDGEGATKFVTIRVSGAASYADAKVVASTIARSPLVKTALYGKDANWGRVLCAIGYAADCNVASVDPSKTSVSFVASRDGSGGSEKEELSLLVDGEPAEGGVDESKAARLLDNEDLDIVVRLGGRGGDEAIFWTCDLSHEYVTINGDYRT